MIVAIKMNDILLGYVEPPKVNNIHIYSEEFAGKRAKNGQLLNVHDALDDLWSIWLNDVPEGGFLGDDLGEFVDWLVSEHRWRRANVDVIEHCVMDSGELL
jgi:hypothetical protein